MSDAISWVLAVDVKDGKLEEYSSLMEEMVASTTEESGALAYEWFVSDDGGQVHIYERYADNAATMVHMGNFGAQFADRFFGCIEPIGMWSTARSTTRYARPSPRPVQCSSDRSAVSARADSGPTRAVHWVIDGNNVYGSRPDGWWNDRDAAAARLAQRVAEWCRTHGDDVLLVFDGPIDERVPALAGGNLEIEESSRRGRDAADHHIVDHVTAIGDRDVRMAEEITVVTSDKGLRDRLPGSVHVVGVGRFRDLVGY